MEKSEMYFKSVNIRAPYIVDEVNKCLRQLHLVRIEYNLNTGKTDFAWVEAETGNFVYGDLIDEQVYASEEQFKRGELLEASDLYSNNDLNRTIYYGLDNVNGSHVHKDGDRYYSFIFHNGAVTKFYYDEHIGKITIKFGNYGKGQRKVETDVEIPKTYYSPEEAYDFNDYEIVHNDGTRTFHEALCNRLKLTKEQEALVDKLQAVINECKKAKIRVDFNLECYNLVAYNVANVERVEYCPCFDEDTEVAHYLNLREARTISGVYDINTEDSSLQFVVKKDTIKTHR